MTSTVRELLDRGVSINFYMFHGGTSFGFMNGAIDIGTYKPQTSSYGLVLFYTLWNYVGLCKACLVTFTSIFLLDYDAPLTESGGYTVKYHLLRNLLSTYNSTFLHVIPSYLSHYGFKWDLWISLFSTSFYTRRAIIRSTVCSEQESVWACACYTLHFSMGESSVCGNGKIPVLYYYKSFCPVVLLIFLSNSITELMIPSTWRIFQQMATTVSRMATRSMRLTYIQVENSTPGIMSETELLWDHFLSGLSFILLQTTTAKQCENFKVTEKCVIPIDAVYFRCLSTENSLVFWTIGLRRLEYPIVR